MTRGDGYQILEGLDLVSVSAGGRHNCGLRTDGRLGSVHIRRSSWHRVRSVRHFALTTAWHRILRLRIPM